MQREGKLTTLDLILCVISASWEVGSLWSVTLPHRTTSKTIQQDASQDLLKKTNFQKVENMIDDGYTDLTQLQCSTCEYSLHTKISDGVSADGFDIRIINSMNESIN